MNHRIVPNRFSITGCVGWLFSFALLIPFLSYAQVDGFEKGDRVRISAPTVQSGKIKGRVALLTSSTMTLSYRDTTLLIPYASIQKAEIVNGKKRNIGKGALIGAASGGLVLGIVSAVSNKPCEDGDWCFFEMTDAEAFGFGALAGALGGAVNGAIIGMFVKTDRWEEVPFTISMRPVPSASSYHSVEPVISVRFSF